MTGWLRFAARNPGLTVTHRVRGSGPLIYLRRGRHYAYPHTPWLRRSLTSRLQRGGEGNSTGLKRGGTGGIICNLYHMPRPRPAYTLPKRRVMCRWLIMDIAGGILSGLTSIRTWAKGQARTPRIRCADRRLQIRAALGVARTKCTFSKLRSSQQATTAGCVCSANRRGIEWRIGNNQSHSSGMRRSLIVQTELPLACRSKRHGASVRLKLQLP